LIIYIAGQKADVEKIKAGIQKRIDNGTLKVVDNYDKIEVLIFHSHDQSLLNHYQMPIFSSQFHPVYPQFCHNYLLSSSSRGNIEITHSDAQKGIALETIAERLNIDMEVYVATAFTSGAAFAIDTE
jgi:hydroxymethylpyrimidine pyrophosphatase-like HAD family hydrolase